MRVKTINLVTLTIRIRILRNAHFFPGCRIEQSGGRTGTEHHFCVSDQRLPEDTTAARGRPAGSLALLQMLP